MRHYPGFSGVAEVSIVTACYWVAAAIAFAAKMAAK